MICKYFLLFHSLPFYFINYVLRCSEVLKFGVVLFVYFCFCCLCHTRHLMILICIALMAEDLHILKGFPGGLDSQESAFNERSPGLIPGLGRSPGGGNGNPFQYSCMEKSHGQRSLLGCNPWGHKESDTTERLHFSLSLFSILSVES